jgi:diguanylate cyclase (GGDEF)-like protein
MKAYGAEGPSARPDAALPRIGAAPGNDRALSEPLFGAARVGHAAETPPREALVPRSPEGAVPRDRPDDHALRRLIRTDQLHAVRRSVLIAMPVNAALGLAAVSMALHYGQDVVPLVWFAASSLVNGLRVAAARKPLPVVPDPDDALEGERFDRTVERQLRFFGGAALFSGVVWACVPLLCQGYTSPQTLFYLTVVCGITAGAVTHGAASAVNAISFITPALLSVIGCLIYAGGFDRLSLAATVLLYLAALVRSALQSEAAFRETSRLTNEATIMARSLRDAHERSIEVAEQMTHRAAHDPLTGLLNRSGFMQEFETCAATARSPLCLMFLDLDGFKMINDVFGHKVGDQVLIEVARRLRQSLSRDVTVARLGGDEFALLYVPGPINDSPERLATELIAAIAIPFAVFDAGRVSASIGIHQALGEDITEMLTCADEALYAAKKAGRNRHHMFDDALRRRLDMRRDIERDLLKALAYESLELWVQPIFRRGGRTLSHFEALIRWEHPKHGWIPPAELVAAAAMSGLSERLMRFILKRACEIVQTLRGQGYERLWVAINVSPREMAQIPVDEIVLATLKSKNVPTSMIEIEITEETAMDIRAVQDKLATLSRAGVRIAIDDFGVGYSSLASLRHLHVDRIKIDRCFVTGIANSTGDQVLVQAILNLARSLGVGVVAEGVETAEDLRMLRSFGCDSMQGYHLGRPMPPRDIIRWIRQHASQSSSAP